MIVLYGTETTDSVAYRSLRAAARCFYGNVTLLVWDNTPIGRLASSVFAADSEEYFAEVVVIAEPRNLGLVAAYNAAWLMAREKDIGWLLTLDQDTQLPEDYLSKFNSLRPSLIDTISACVPVVCEGKTICSPVRTLGGLPWQFLAYRDPGPAPMRLSAINSGAFVRVGFLSSIGGYSTNFSLDFVDHWLCRTIYESGQQIQVLPTVIEHQLSVNSFATDVSLNRYRSILAAQRHYVLSDRSIIPRLVLLTTLPLHALRKLMQGTSLPFIRAAISEWWRLLRGCLSAPSAKSATS